MRFTIKTIGCKVNTYESNKIKAELIDAGLIFVDVDKKEEYKDLDFYIINTCSVTSVADKKSRQMIHSAKKLNKKLKIIAMGCYDPSNDADVDLYISNANKKDFTKIFLIKYGTAKNDKLIMNKPVINKISKVREFIKIQDGCNQYCTYCIIPYLRGNIKSRPNNEIIDEIKDKVKNGTKEIVLTGIHLSSFGVDREGIGYEAEGAINIGRKALLTIIKAVADIDGVLRIRLGSLEPRIINDDFIKTLSEGALLEKFCDNFCLSLQSGSDKVLKAMNRHYTTTDFENACGIIRKYMKDATITADVIVGFPGETDDDFKESLEFVKRMRFYNPNIFPYSRRKGTKADTFINQISNEIKHKRAKIMIDECEKITKEIEDSYDFSKYPILVEEEIVENNEVFKVGYTKEYIKRKLRMKMFAKSI